MAGSILRALAYPRTSRKEPRKIMEQCPVCGKPYGITHDCPGPSRADATRAAKWRAPEGFAPLHYLRQAIAIARLDDSAILAASHDSNALDFGAVLWFVGQVLIFGSILLRVSGKGPAFHWELVLYGVGSLIVLDGIFLLAQYGLCHLLARVLFGAQGTYVRLLRPLLLGSVVMWLGVVPYIGLPGAGLWSIAIMMITFEEVDRISRLKAFGLSAVIGVAFRVLAASFLHIY